MPVKTIAYTNPDAMLKPGSSARPLFYPRLPDLSTNYYKKLVKLDQNLNIFTGFIGDRVPAAGISSRSNCFTGMKPVASPLHHFPPVWQLE